MRRSLAVLSPRRRRWLRHLRSLPLDPTTMPAVLEAPSPRDFIICGSPRTGTALLTAALYQPPRVVTVMEPWDGMRLAPAELFKSLRAEIAETGTFRRGRLDLGALLDAGRVAWCLDGASARPVELDPDAAVGVKWPTFWQYLPRLPDTRFLVCIRHPVEVIASYRANGGRLGEGLEYDTRFNRPLNDRLRAATDDPALRRVLLYDAINEQLLPFLDRPNVFVVRYERWFDDPDGLLGEIGAFLEVDASAPSVRVQPRRDAIDLPPHELELIRARCRTAAPLGYDLAGVLDR